MDTEKLTDLVEDEVLNQLPDEAIDQLLELSKTEGDHEMEINVILKQKFAGFLMKRVFLHHFSL